VGPGSRAPRGESEWGRAPVQCWAAAADRQWPRDGGYGQRTAGMLHGDVGRGGERKEGLRACGLAFWVRPDEQ
jgi:hypothetical protein